MSLQQIGYIRRSCDLLKYCSEGNTDHFSPSSPWMRTLCRPWQSILKSPPTAEQISDPEDIYTLAWKVNNAIADLGYPKSTSNHFRLEGIEAILHRFYLEGEHHYSADLLNKIVEEKRAEYVEGTVCENTFCRFRKVAIWMQEMHQHGIITATKTPSWGLRELSEHFLSVHKKFSSDPKLTEHFSDSSMKTGRYAVRRFLFELEDNGYFTLTDITRNSISKCLNSLAKHFTSGLPTITSATKLQHGHALM